MTILERRLLHKIYEHQYKAGKLTRTYVIPMEDKDYPKLCDLRDNGLVIINKIRGPYSKTLLSCFITRTGRNLLFNEQLELAYED
jgi:hypothetical protein